MARRKTKTRAGTRGPGRDQRLVEDRGRDQSYEVSQQLRRLIADPATPASAKVMASRTLAEIGGLIGRHQTAPERGDRPLSVLSRDELTAELERLRTAVGLGIV